MREREARQTGALKKAGVLSGAIAICAIVVWIASSSSDKPALPSPPPSASIAAPRASSVARRDDLLVPELTTVEGDDSFRLLVFTIPLDRFRLRAIDVAMTKDFAPVLEREGAALVMNGGFFDRQSKAEGLVISDGKTLAPKSVSLGGGIVAIAKDRSTLFAAEAYPTERTADFAIQARPRLVVKSASNIGSDDGRSAERTALCLREEGRVLEVVIARGETPGKGPTLALLADMLVSRGCEDALNLDGGPSTGAAWREGSGDIASVAPRGGVRFAVAITTKKAP